MTSKVIYKGALRTESVHLRSGSTIITDAPIDNHGKGATFSPTDLVATALANCIITVMGIVANRKSIDITGTQAEVTKTMASNPRRISAIRVRILFPTDKQYTASERSILEHTARTCPVALSLSQDLVQDLSFVYA